MTERKVSSKKSLSHRAILFGFTVLVLLFDSIIILTSGLRKGIFKKEILSKKSTIGFDFKIIIK